MLHVTCTCIHSKTVPKRFQTKIKPNILTGPLDENNINDDKNQ